MRESGTSAPKRPPCVETAVSRFGRTFRISTTSVSPGWAPSIAIGPTSPGHFPPAFSYHSPHSVSLSTTSPGLTVSTGSRTAKVGWPTLGTRRWVSAFAGKGGASAVPASTSVATACAWAGAAKRTTGMGPPGFDERGSYAARRGSGARTRLESPA